MNRSYTLLTQLFASLLMHNPLILRPTSSITASRSTSPFDADGSHRNDTR